MQVQPYLYFGGKCEEAIAFYTKAIGAEVAMLMRFKDAPDPAMTPPGAQDKVMHASLRIGDNTVLVSDGRCEGQQSFLGFSLFLRAANEAEAGRLFNALAAGGKVQMPLAKTFFSPSFGSAVDRFGVTWLVGVVPG
jgi:PhnB protein